MGLCPPAWASVCLRAPPAPPSLPAASLCVGESQVRKQRCRTRENRASALVNSSLSQLSRRCYIQPSTPPSTAREIFNLRGILKSRFGKEGFLWLLRADLDIDKQLGVNEGGGGRRVFWSRDVIPSLNDVPINGVDFDRAETIVLKC